MEQLLQLVIAAILSGSVGAGGIHFGKRIRDRRNGHNNNSSMDHQMLTELVTTMKARNELGDKLGDEVAALNLQISGMRREFAELRGILIGQGQK